MSDEPPSFDGRDFGRLEGKVDTLVSNVVLFQKSVDALSVRVSAIETDNTAIKAEQDTIKATATNELVRSNARNSTYQTIIAVGAIAVAIVAVAMSIFK
jgi:hypothetical protein